uniref:Methyltransferase domain-containing protein n=1 Tax=Pyrodinium bahamense TaxID=73915 RepID=A0A7S0AB23_9DINO
MAVAAQMSPVDGGPLPSDESCFLDDRGFRWAVYTAPVGTEAHLPSDFEVGDDVWVRLGRNCGCHGSVDAVHPGSTAEIGMSKAMSPEVGGASHGVGKEAAPGSEAASPQRRRLRVDGKGRSRSDVTVRVGEDTEVQCGFERLTHLLPVTAQAACVAIVADTLGYRQLARCQVTAQDRVVEIGSSTGLCTTILHAQASSVIGFDLSLAQLDEARQAFPEVRFEFLNIFEEPDRLRDMPEASGCTVAFLDIGGDREISQVVHAIELLRRHCLPSLRLLVVKSEELHAAAVAWASEVWLKAGGARKLKAPDAFMQPWAHLRVPTAPRPRGEQLCVQDSPTLPRGAGSALQHKKKRALCGRARAAAAASAAGSLSIPLGTLEACLPCCCTHHSGFHCVDLGSVFGEVACCLILDENDHPLVRSHKVVCVFGTHALASRLARAAEQQVPVFLGRGGARAAPYEFWGSFCAQGVLSDNCPLYCDASVQALRSDWEMRLRRRTDDLDIRLLQLHCTCSEGEALRAKCSCGDGGPDEGPDAAVRLTFPPRHHAEATSPEAWVEVLRQRRTAAAAAAA